jgi:hypothetical protein
MTRQLVIVDCGDLLAVGIVWNGSPTLLKVISSFHMTGQLVIVDCGDLLAVFGNSMEWEVVQYYSKCD